MNATTSSSSAYTFSWQRVSMIARYYYPSLRTQIVLYPTISIVLAVIITLGRPAVVSIVTGGEKALGISNFFSTMAVGLAGTACQFMFYLAPIIFIRRSRDIDISLPALWKEKATFVMLYLFVFIPLALYGPMFTINAIGDIISTHELASTILDSGITIGTQEISYDSLSLFLPMSVCAYIVFSYPKASMGRAAGFTILSLVAMGLIGFVCYTIIIIPITQSNPELLRQAEGFSNVLSEHRFVITRYLIAGVTTAFTLMFAGLTIRSFKKIQL